MNNLQKLNINIEFLKENYPKYGARRCGEILDIPTKEVTVFCNSHGMRRLSGHSRNGKTGTINDEIFMKKMSPKSVYVLGYLWADGHICVKTSCISLEIKKDDALAIRDIMMEVGEWRITERQRYRDNKEFGKIQTSYSAVDQKFVSWCVDMGFSSKSIESPNILLYHIPEELHHYFWRGFFDGDGNLYINHKNEFSFWGSYNQNWEDLERVLTSIGVRYKIRRDHNKKKQGYSQIYCCNYEGVNLFMSYISRGEIFGLMRKRLSNPLIDRRRRRNNN